MNDRPKRRAYFDDYWGDGWPSLDWLRSVFDRALGRNGFGQSDNDNWGFDIKGLDGTAGLPRTESVNAHLTLTGSPEHGVTLQYDRWNGRIKKGESYNSVGDLTRLGEFVRSLHGDPLSIGLFISFERAWGALKEFIETDGALPASIEWISARDLPPKTFPDP